MKPLCKLPSGATQLQPVNVRPSVVKAILSYLAASPNGADIQELQTAFASTTSAAASLKTMRARLHNMVNRDQICTEGVGTFRRWYAVQGRSKAQPKPETTTQGTTGQLVPTSRLALPDGYDVMRAPVYVPPSMGGNRAGADDHTRCLSRGHRC